MRFCMSVLSWAAELIRLTDYKFQQTVTPVLIAEKRQGTALNAQFYFHAKFTQNSRKR